MSKIELNSRDMHIRTLDDGRKLVQLKGAVAFDESFIDECVDLGVKPEHIKDENKTPDDLADPSDED
jgi:ABC-type Fe3+-citrate transport system substrate-binding protein